MCILLFLVVITLNNFDINIYCFPSAFLVHAISFHINTCLQIKRDYRIQNNIISFVSMQA